MLKLKKYFKPFIGMIILAMVILFVQVMCDLKLPDYMSEIVNVGIQANGIENVSPEAISENGLNLMTAFMTEENKDFVYSNYTKIEAGNEDYKEEYPAVENENIYLLNEDLEDETVEKIDKLFSVSGKTMINMAEKMSQTQDSQTSAESLSTSTGSVNFDLEQIYQMLPMISNIPEETLNEARLDAEKTDESTLSSIGKVFTKAFYEELGLDISKIQSKYIRKIGLEMLGVCLISILAAISVGYVGSKVGAGVGKNLRNDVFKKVQSFSTAEFNKFSSASLITRTTNDITQIQNLVVMLIRMLAYAPIMGVGALIMMSQKSTSLIWTIALACGCIILLIVFLFFTVLPKIKIVQKLVDKINLVAKENLSGLMVVRAFGTQKYEENRFDEVNEKVMKNNKFINRSMSMMMPAMMLIMNLLSLLILWVGADKVAASSMQVGDLMAAMQYGTEVVMSFLMISMIFVMLPRASVSAGRIVEVLETESTINDPINAEKFDNDKTGYVEFKNVSFKYPEADEYVLQNINFTAKPGETTAIIGATGSGKSTVINLIPRLFDATEGEVLVNGVNVKKVNQHNLQEQIGFVPQKGSLLSGTIESNLKYGNEKASKQFVEKCSKVAQASDFIESKDEKYDSLISQGAKNVSGGQKQRLSIARALVKDAPIYIFDDSFSALDFKTDSNLRKALKEHSKDSTLIIVAQRVSTIMNAEQILVLDEGKLVGLGTHKELLENCPTYYEIASSQLSEEELKNGK